MTGRRIEFPSDDAARFNALRDQWRGAAASLPLSRSAMRIATVLPTYVNREFGYAFPTDEQLAADIKSDPKTAKRGLTALEQSGLIERETQARRGGVGAVAGKVRRIFLCLPTEGTTSHEPKGQPSSPKGRNAVLPKGQRAAPPKGQSPKGHPEPKGQKSLTEGTYGCPYIPDTHTPDVQIRSGDRKVSVYGEAVPSVDPSPRADPSVTGPTFRSERAVARNPYPTPKSWGTDEAFLAAFDRLIFQSVRQGVAAGQIERITAEAFDGATRETESMPVYWVDILALRSNAIAEWFRARAGSLIHSEVA